MKKLTALILSLILVLSLCPMASAENVYTSTFIGIDGEPVEVTSGLQFPLKEKVTLTFWYSPGWNFIGDMKSLAEGEVWQWMEDQTNVHIEFIHPAS